MSRCRLAAVLSPLVGLFALALLPAARAQAPAAAPGGTSAAAQPGGAPGQPGGLTAKQSGKAMSAFALSGRIDRHISAKWRKEGVVGSKPADDAVFFRRVYLDLNGKIPTILDIRDFMEDDRPDKRQIWVDKLLESEAFADHFANVYRSMMLTQVENQETAFLIGGFENWLRKKLKDNTPYNKMVYELLTSGTQPNFGRGPDDFNTASPAAFYAANEYKPENLAGATARLFLGVKIECAQCHKHPFADWTRNQFWEFSAFFQNLSPNGGPFAAPAVDDEGGKTDKPKVVQPGNPGDGPSILIPKTDPPEYVKAKFLDGSAPKWNGNTNARTVVADWITSPDNPYFSRIAVNQMWYYLMGTGLVEPYDDFGEHNPCSHQELLDELADQFVKSGYDLKYLARAIVNSKTYQMSSAPLAKKADEEQDSPRLFTRMSLRALSGEQLFDSLAEVMNYKVDKNRVGFPLGQTPREEFISKFSSPENKRVDVHTSILQALHLMNGKFLANATSLEKNENLRTIADSKPRPTEEQEKLLRFFWPSYADGFEQRYAVREKVTTLYYLALARPPRMDELDRMTRYVMSGGARKDEAQAIADVLWVLLNSAEFASNH